MQSKSQAFQQKHTKKEAKELGQTETQSKVKEKPQTYMLQSSKIQKNKQTITELVMSENCIDNTFMVVTLDEKIEKLRQLIAEANSGNSKIKHNQVEKIEKLQQKLRYLEYFKDYSVGTIVHPR